MRPWWIAIGAASLGLVVAGTLRAPFMSVQAASYVSDLGQLGAAIAACVACAVASRRAAAHRSRSWRWLSIGTGAWASGQAVWSWYELVLGREVPFPSLADAGFLVFPVAMAVGLVTWLGSQGDQLVARGRDFLDATVIAASLLVLSWVTALGSVLDAGADTRWSLLLSLAYPVGDLIVATLMLIALVRATRGERAALVVLALGLGWIAFSDSAYVYLVGLGDYTSADLVSSGWIVGFLLVAAAGLGVPRSAEVMAVADAGPIGQRSTESNRLRLVLPYVPLVAAGGVLVVEILRSDRTQTVDVLLGVALVFLVLTRQFLAMLDNFRLLGELGAARDELQHQAGHDGLTGLPNRTLFSTALQRALDRPGHDVSVLFCDLDDFKLVNDTYGHDVGDELLQVVALRLVQAVRASDTVARLGGDEFAILVDSDRAVEVAERVVHLLGRPVELRGRLLSMSTSVGIAHHTDFQPLSIAPAPDSEAQAPATGMTARLLGEAQEESLATLLLRRADIAMYAAKGAGKGRAVLDQPALDTRSESLSAG